METGWRHQRCRYRLGNSVSDWGVVKKDGLDKSATATRAIGPQSDITPEKKLEGMRKAIRLIDAKGRRRIIGRSETHGELARVIELCRADYGQDMIVGIARGKS